MKRITQTFRGPKNITKKSRFIATIFPITNKNQLDDSIAKISEEMKKASHNAYAFRYQINNKIIDGFSDDGEVRTTAGIPILNLLEQFEVMNVILFVTRFYGGINLGKGGLIRAYSTTARDLIINVPLQDID